MFSADSHCLIGQSHVRSGKPCQDYAVSGVYQDSAYAIIADGCSTGKRTDVGSRILALSTSQAIKGIYSRFGAVGVNADDISIEQIRSMQNTSLELGLSQQDLLATCLYAYMSPHGGHIHIKGDGVIAYKFRDGATVVHNCEWANNTPYYPAYIDNAGASMLFPVNRAAFIKTHGGDVDAIKMTNEIWQFTADEFVLLDEVDITLGEGVRGITVPLSFENLEFVAVFSDGATQIDKLDWREAVKQLLSFKTTQGAFAQKRMNRMMKNLPDGSKGPIDDISYAVIYANPDSEEI